jgi:uncharacterized protein (DUF1778 family)
MNDETMTARTKRIRSERIEVRATPKDRALIDRAVEALDTDLTSFVMSNLTMAAHRVLADRTEFVLDDEGRDAWEEINSRAPRDVVGLSELMERPSPFVDE